MLSQDPILLLSRYFISSEEAVFDSIVTLLSFSTSHTLFLSHAHFFFLSLSHTHTHTQIQVTTDSHHKKKFSEKKSNAYFSYPQQQQQLVCVYVYVSFCFLCVKHFWKNILVENKQLFGFCPNFHPINMKCWHDNRIRYDCQKHDKANFGLYCPWIDILGLS